MKILKHLGFKVIIAVTMSITTIFWDMMLCSLVDAYLVYSQPKYKDNTVF